MSASSDGTETENLAGAQERKMVNSERRDREGTRLVGVHVPESVYRALRMLAAKRGVSMSALLLEWYADMLQMEGIPPLPELERDRDDYRKYGRRRRRDHIGKGESSGDQA